MSELIPQEALEALPVFPLPGTLLLPQTLVSLHVFEPRYRRMMEHVLEGHRVLSVAMLDEAGAPDAYGRPPLFGVAGVGIVRRSARLPDGRYNIMVEGVLRADIHDELPPSPSIPYRRVRARALPDVESIPRAQLEEAADALRALCLHVVSELGETDAALSERLHEITDPSALADVVAATALSEAEERQRVLAEPDVARRLQLASGALGALMIRAHELRGDKSHGGWGMGSGDA